MIDPKLRKFLDDCESQFRYARVIRSYYRNVVINSNFGILYTSKKPYNHKIIIGP